MVLVLGLVWALLHAFGGYPLFRLLLSADALLGGFSAGWWLMGLYRPGANLAESILAGLLGGILGCLAAWKVCRLTFCSLLAGLSAWALAWTLDAGNAGVWIASAAFGGVLAAAAYARLGKAVVLTSSVGGAVACVILLSQSLGWSRPADWLADHLAPAAVTLALGCLLAILGIRVQVRSPRYILTRFAPPSRRALRGRRTPRHRTAPGIAPHFTSL